MKAPLLFYCKTCQSGNINPKNAEIHNRQEGHNMQPMYEYSALRENSVQKTLIVEKPLLITEAAYNDFQAATITLIVVIVVMYILGYKIKKA